MANDPEMYRNTRGLLLLDMFEQPDEGGNAAATINNFITSYRPLGTEGLGSEGSSRWPNAGCRGRLACQKEGKAAGKAAAFHMVTAQRGI
ncbi:hypothetical protein CMUS01_00255 [Colletotrichum musicola]|uniref:Uncharacterized protein n=1 Tax=Colletotrichum musicola TaxID=2175873 RepID=A0A8H6UAA7_9PEZI|nr:hypothetical protein CMUS01_00255 [Colletotrichum musicola]